VPGLDGHGIEADPQKDLEISYKTTRHRFSTTTPDICVCILSWTAGMTANLAAMLLYDLIKRYCRKPPEKITIDRYEITFDKGEIEKVIQEHITREK